MANMICSFKKIEYDLLFWATSFIIGLFQIFYLFHAAQYFIPLGDDVVIYFWPVGQFMAQSSLKDFFISLVSSFFREDHLSPVCYFFGYLCYILSPADANPSLVLNIAGKLLYLIIVISSLSVVFVLWKDRQRVLIFFLLLAFNLSLSWRVMIVPTFSISAVFSLWCLFFLHRFLQKEKRSDLIFFCCIFFITTFSFETSFIVMPLLAVYAFFVIWGKPIPMEDKIKNISMIYALMFLFFLPYLIIHTNLYGSPMRRLSDFAGMSHLFHGWYSRSIWLMSEWFFDIGHRIEERGMVLRIFSNATLPIITFLVYKFRLLSRTGIHLLMGFLSQLFCMLCAGRFEPGLWFLAGIIFLMIIADILHQAMDKISRYRLKNFTIQPCHIVLFIMPLFIVYNTKFTPFPSWAETSYGMAYRSTQAAYKAIGEGAERMTVIILPNASSGISSVSFWLGNRIYNRQPSLWLFPKHFIFHNKKMHMEYYLNREKRPFNYFRPLLTLSPENKKVVVFKDRNLFSRIFLDSNGARILRAGVIPKSFLGSLNIFELHLPDLSKYNRRASKLDIILTFPDDSYRIDGIVHNGIAIRGWRKFGNKVLFEIKSASDENQLTVNSSEIELLEVNFPQSSSVIFNSPREEMSENLFSIAAPEGIPCDYSMNSSAVDIDLSGILDGGETRSFNILLFKEMLKKDIQLIYRTLEHNRKKRKYYTLKLNDYSQSDFPLEICTDPPRKDAEIFYMK